MFFIYLEMCENVKWTNNKKQRKYIFTYIFHIFLLTFWTLLATKLRMNMCLSFLVFCEKVEGPASCHLIVRKPIIVHQLVSPVVYTPEQCHQLFHIRSVERLQSFQHEIIKSRKQIPVTNVFILTHWTHRVYLRPMTSEIVSSGQTVK